MHTHKKSRFVIIPQKSVNFSLNKIKEKTGKRVTATEGALSFHAVKHYIGDNYSLHCVYSFITHKI
jgi:hypothetical protein